jgi:hypothetical protein
LLREPDHHLAGTIAAAAAPGPPISSANAAGLSDNTVSCVICPNVSDRSAALSCSALAMNRRGWAAPYFPSEIVSGSAAEPGRAQMVRRANVLAPAGGRAGRRNPETRPRRRSIRNGRRMHAIAGPNRDRAGGNNRSASLPSFDGPPGSAAGSNDQRRP